MQDEELLEKIYTLQTESNERDVRLETRLEYLSQRMEKTESLLEKMSDILNEQKHLNSVVDTLALQVGKVASEISAQEKRIASLEQRPEKAVFSVFNRIIWIVVPMIVAAIVSGFGTWLKRG